MATKTKFNQVCLKYHVRLSRRTEDYLVTLRGNAHVDFSMISVASLGNLANAFAAKFDGRNTDPNLVRHMVATDPDPQ